MNKKFLVSWEGYPGNPPDAVVDSDYFAEMEFDAEDQKKINALFKGESYTTGGPFDSVIITRTE